MSHPLQPANNDSQPAFAQLDNPPPPPPLPPISDVNSLARQQERVRQRQSYRNRQTDGVAFLDHAWNGPDWLPADLRSGLGSVGLATPGAKEDQGALRVAVIADQVAKPHRPGQAPPRLHLSGKTAEAVLKSLREQYPEPDDSTDNHSIAASTDFSFNPGDDYFNDNDSEPEIPPSEPDIFFDAHSHRTFSHPPDTPTTDTMAETHQPAPAHKRDHEEFAQDMGCNEALRSLTKED
ncbi:hypothetical protein HG530_014624 [Fusarium avenaceum]|nr:hypothetical protein HG530_014624 [Fusarium avenaceum]